MTTLETEWGRTAYFESGGAGFPILFLHGTGCDSSDWAGVLESLPQHLRLVCMDFRGHGDSSDSSEPFTLQDLAQDALLLADHLGLSEFLVAGHSLGGMVGIEAATRATAVAGLVLLEGWTSLAVRFVRLGS